MLKLVFLVLLALDCLGNMLVSIGRPGFTTSWQRTLSATAWSVRENKWTWWLHWAIDIGAIVLVWQFNHTQTAWNNEQAYGNVWRRVFKNN